jgi:hypothetical protein
MLFYKYRTTAEERARWGTKWLEIVLSREQGFDGDGPVIGDITAGLILDRNPDLEVVGRNLTPQQAMGLLRGV